MIQLDWIAKKISVPKKTPSPSYPPPTPWLGEAELQEKCGEPVGSNKIHSCQERWGKVLRRPSRMTVS